MSVGVVYLNESNLMPCGILLALFTEIFRFVSNFRMQMFLMKHENVYNINGHKLITYSS